MSLTKLLLYQILTCNLKLKADAFAKGLGYSTPLRAALVKLQVFSIDHLLDISHISVSCLFTLLTLSTCSTFLIQEENLSAMNTDPWYSAYHYSHPPLVERLAAIDEPDKKTD